MPQPMTHDFLTTGEIDTERKQVMKYRTACELETQDQLEHFPG